MYDTNSDSGEPAWGNQFYRSEYSLAVVSLALALQVEHVQMRARHTQ